MLPRHIGNKIARTFRSVIHSGALNSSKITLRWREPSGSAPIPGIETNADPVPEERTEAADALVHYVSPGTTAATRYSQAEKGDVILDFLGDVQLDAKPGLRFEIGGQIYVQKESGTDLAASWDVRCNGIPITRTILVTLLS